MSTDISDAQHWGSPSQRALVTLSELYINNCERAILSIDRLCEWTDVRNRWISLLERWLPDHVVDSSGRYELDGSVASTFEREGLIVENVLFRSSYGWQINGTVFRPKGGDSLPGVVCPTGSSTKLNRTYWTSAQLIARSGYVVLSYDPPGFVGERREGSDAFANGPVGYLTGIHPRGFYVADTSAAIDYLSSRNDVAAGRGFAVTGLSLGAQTTVNAAMHDDRIRFIAPVCGIMSNLDYLFPELYTVNCTNMIPGMYRLGLESGRFLSLCAPTPCLLIGGAYDEIVTPEITRREFEKARGIYSLYDASDQIECYIDEDAGHEYSASMVRQVVRRLDDVFDRDGRPFDDSIVELDTEAMKSHPDTSINIRSLNALRAHELTQTRDERGTAGRDLMSVRRTLRDSLGVGTDGTTREISGEAGARIVKTWPTQRSWVHDFSRIQIETIARATPGLLVERAYEEPHRSPGLVFVDEGGMWAGLTKGGYAARSVRFLERTHHAKEPVLLSIDAAGFGSDEPVPSVYDSTAWADPDSTLAYVAIALGTPLVGLRVRDTLAAISALMTVKGVDPANITVAGIGDGAIAALFASVIDGTCARTLLIDPPVSFAAIAAADEHAWSRSSFVPGLLESFDVSDLIEMLEGECVVVRPLDAMRKPVPENVCTDAYHASTQVMCVDSVEDRDQKIVQAVLHEY